ncbi:MAG: glycosyltransferase family 4 protein [Deltaproteobacteria bacterium]|jgi:glycosyltransferase involved in cell wall biosynthesis|nr:glycosyltransferase family 4 protein [Deltaproteobacteria bacterium]MBW2543590.1 glycosyltransferase family 4 protein [Deltaproteobacteria bacterium]
MKILLVHNFYRQHGGESAVFEAERRMLEAAGHSVVSYTRDSKEIEDFGPWQRAALAPAAVWARDSHREIGELIAREAPDVAHFTNTFPLISPSAYYACRDARVPVVQSIHNYRLVCPAAMLWRDGSVCEECIDRSLLRSVQHACYHESRLTSAVLATALAIHRRCGTFTKLVDRYIALTEFARGKLVAGGIPPERISIKPNFIDPDPGVREGSGNYALFAGRLTLEKGVHTLLDAWKRIGADIPLRIAGDGPLREALARRIETEGIAGISLLGSLTNDTMMRELRGARVLVFPSEWYEGMPMTILEAFACGVPTVSARLGGMQEMIEDGRNGLLVAPGDAEGIAARVRWLFEYESEAAELGRAARADYEARYTAAANYTQLLDIYRQAIECGGGRAS